MRQIQKYGTCKYCKEELVPIYFTEEETRVEHGVMIKTGRKRRAVDCLICPKCLKEYCVDDSFDGGWHK